MEAIQVKIQDLINDENFIQKLLSCEDAAEAQDLFIDQDIPLTQEEIRKGYQVLKRHQENGTVELTEEELTSVSGGYPFFIALLFGLIKAIVAGVIGGAVEAAMTC